MAKLILTNAIAEDLKTAASDSFIDSLKIDEVNDIFRNNPDLAQMYVQRRTEHRRAKDIMPKAKPPHR